MDCLVLYCIGLGCSYLVVPAVAPDSAECTCLLIPEIVCYGKGKGGMGVRCHGFEKTDWRRGDCHSCRKWKDRQYSYIFLVVLNYTSQSGHALVSEAGHAAWHLEVSIVVDSPTVAQ
jgi:hypothetical protein